MDTLFILLKQGYDIPGTRSRSDQIGVIVQRSEEQLILPKLAAVELHSPGFWEILGSLSPLKFISDCLQFWHERSKDKEYRNTSEAARLWLENEQKKNEVFRQRIDLMKSVGISDDELRRQFFEPIAASVSVLYDLSKSGVVTPNSASITVHSKDGENNV